MIRVSDIMTPRVVVINPNDTLSRARNLMLRYNISRLIVIDEFRKPVGILTETDVALKIWEESFEREARPINEILVREVMSKSVVCIKPKQPITSAAKVMLEKRISGLPVVDEEGCLIGIITKTDLTRAYAQHFPGAFRVRDLMSSPVITVHPMHTVYRVGKLMKEHGISRVIVVDNKTPIGIVTKTDLSFIEPLRKPRKIKYASRIVRLLRIPLVMDVMTPNPITVDLDEDLADAAKIMVNNGISGLPVVNNEGELEGIVTKTDVVKAISMIKMTK